MQKTSRLNRLLAVLVAVFMAVCCLPLNAFAAEKTYMVDFVFHVGDSTGGEYLDDWTKTGVKVEAYNRIMVSDLLEKASVPMPVGYELANPDEKIDIDADRVVDIEVKKIPEEPSEPEEPTQPELKEIIVQYLNSENEEVAAGFTMKPNDILPLTDNLKDGYNGENLKGWNYEGQYLGDKGTVFTFEELKEKIGDNVTPEGQCYMNLYAVYNETPAEPEYVTFKIHFQSPDGTDYMDPYTLTGGDIGMPVAGQIPVPDGYTLENWQLQGTGFVCAPGTSITFGELNTIVKAPAGATTDVYFVAVLKQDAPEPEEKPLSRMTVRFVDNNLNDLAESYSLTGGDVALPAADAVAVPEGSKLLGWTLRDYGQNLYAPGTTMTFGELATVVGDGYDKETGEVYLYFYAVYEGDTQTVGLNFYDEENHEQVCETTVELPADAIHLNTSKIELPEGYEFVETGDLAINDGWIYVGVKPIKTLRIYWAIDNGEAADFADGSADTWTQELSWKHINDEIAMPEITVKDGYVFNGWSVGGQNSEFWGPELATMTVGDKFVADEKGGVISITANIVAKTEDTGDTGATGGDSGSDSSNKNTTTTATATSANSGEEVVKADTPADPTVKVLPQTGVRVETPVVFGGMLFAALAGAGAYLFAMRKKLNETF